MTVTNTPGSSASSPSTGETVTEANWRKIGIVVAVGSLLPAAILAPILYSTGVTRLVTVAGLLQVFASLAMTFAFLVAIGVCVALFTGDGGPFMRPRFRFALLADAVELRDGQGNVLGATADGTLRVTSINLHFGRSMVGGVRLDHRGGTMLLTPRNPVAPWPGMTAVAGAWVAVSNATYEALLRHAA